MSCLALFCAELNCNTAPCSPGAFGHAHVCCFNLSLKADSDVMCGEEGCLSVITKACCCAAVVTTKKCPIIGVCDNYIMGEPVGEGDKPVNFDADAAFLNDMFWCLYLGCVGIGVTKSMEPICTTGATACCLELSTWCDMDCCPESKGMVNVALKLWCCGVLARFPPSSDIGLGCCGIWCMAPAEGREGAADSDSPYLDLYEAMPPQERKPRQQNM